MEPPETVALLVNGIQHGCRSSGDIVQWQVNFVQG